MVLQIICYIDKQSGVNKHKLPLKTSLYQNCVIFSYIQENLSVKLNAVLTKYYSDKHIREKISSYFYFSCLNSNTYLNFENYPNLKYHILIKILYNNYNLNNWNDRINVYSYTYLVRNELECLSYVTSELMPFSVPSLLNE